MSHFWIDGPGQYEQALEAEYRTKLDALKRQIDSAGDGRQREALQKQLRELKTNHAATLRAIRWSLFHRA